MHNVVALTKTPLSLSFTLHCWRIVTIVHIPKSGNSIPLAKLFRRVVLTSSGLETVELIVLRLLCSSIGLPEAPFQSACRSNRSTLDAVASLIHHIYNFLDVLMRYVLYGFLIYIRFSSEVSPTSQTRSVWLPQDFTTSALWLPYKQDPVHTSGR